MTTETPLDSETPPENNIVSKMFVHSCELKSKFSSSVVVKERIKYADGTIKPNIKVYKNPKRHFYLTKLTNRTYKFKPEYELLSKLDRFTCYDYELHAKLAQIFNLGTGYVPRQHLFKSPYLFGADISMEALIKMHYLNTYPNANLKPTVGFLDIETSIDTGQIIMISFHYENIVHTAILESFFFEEIKGNRVPLKKDVVLKYVQANLASRTSKLNLTYDLQIFDSEMKLIAWTMKHVHESMVDFISIWNMNFDIPRILDAIDRHRYNAADLFTAPILPRELRYLRYYEDPRPVAHFTLKWHWLYSTCGSQFIDSQGLFSQCRKTAGYRGKYDLNSILNEEIGTGKLPLTDGSHVIMQRHHFKDYVVYNIFDVVGLRLLEDKNNDFLTMSVLCGPSPVSKFNAQTHRSTNAMYHDLIGKGQVLSTYSPEDDFIKFDKLAPNAGGTVLPPDRVNGVGVQLTV